MSGRKRDRSPEANVVKVRGLPYEATAIDLCKYFTNCKIKGGARGIWFCVNDRNLPTGVAYMELNSYRDVDMAKRMHKSRMGSRYLEIYDVAGSELEVEKRRGATNEFGFNENRREYETRSGSFGGGSRGFGGDFGGRGGGGFGRGGGSAGGRSSSPRNLGPPRNAASEHCIKLRGLPFTADREDVLQFLEDVDVCGGSKGVVFIMEAKSHRPSGDAYVEVKSSDDIDRALKYHRKNLGSRYVEVFEANSKDVARAKDRAEDDKELSKAFKVNLRGLPYSTTEREISDWVSEAAKTITVELTYDKQGRPSGSAYAYFKTEDEAKAVAKEMHKRDLGTRYIEVYYDDVTAEYKKENRDRSRSPVRDRSRSPIRGRRSRSRSESN